MNATMTHQELARREEVVRLGLWMFLATVTMLFAAFASAYVVRRTGSDWRHVALPSILWLNTAVLVASSGAVEGAWYAGVRRRWPASSAAFGVAITLGATFLAGQVIAWRELAGAGVFLPSSPHSSFFYMMTGAHALHVVAALLVLLSGAVKTWSGAGRRNPRAWQTSIAVCRTFWHYLLGVWIFLFLFVSTY